MTASGDDDLIDGLDVNPATAQHTSGHQRKTYDFCAPGCRRACEADLARYRDPNYKPSM